MASPSRRQTLTRLAAALAATSGTASAASYSQTQRCAGTGFADCFNFFTDRDPTNGFVQYVNQSYAESSGLYRASGSSVIMGADSSNIYPVTSAGRPSLRLESKFTNTHALYVLDLNHMPVGCGTWPAFWTLGPNWPNNGEIDILEGVNTQPNNLASLHSGDSCTVAGTNQLGALLTADCAVSTSTTGCSTRAPNAQSYGAGFNAGQGGVYAMEWTSTAIRTWFFPRGAIPASISSGRPDPASDFGMPQSNFQGGCDIDSHFRDHRVLFDLTFCGDWAGNTFLASGCPASGAATSMDACKAYVANTPAAFRDAFWDINALSVYSATGGADPASQPAPASPAAATRPIAATSAVVANAQAPAPAGNPAAAPAPAPAVSPAPAPAPGSPDVYDSTTTLITGTQTVHVPFGGGPATPAPAAPAPAPAPAPGPVPGHGAAPQAVLAPPPSPPPPAGPAPSSLQTSYRTVLANLVNTDAAGAAEQLSSQTLITQTIDHFPAARRAEHTPSIMVRGRMSWSTQI